MISGKYMGLLAGTLLVLALVAGLEEVPAHSADDLCESIHCDGGSFCEAGKCRCPKDEHLNLETSACEKNNCTIPCGDNAYCSAGSCRCNEGFENFAQGGAVNCSKIIESIATTTEVNENLSTTLEEGPLLGQSMNHSTTTTTSKPTSTTTSKPTTTAHPTNTTTKATTKATTTTALPTTKPTKAPHKAGMSAWAITGIIVLVASILGFSGFMIYKYKQRGAYRATSTTVH